MKGGEIRIPCHYIFMYECVCTFVYVFMCVHLCVCFCVCTNVLFWGLVMSSHPAGGTLVGCLGLLMHRASSDCAIGMFRMIYFVSFLPNSILHVGHTVKLWSLLLGAPPSTYLLYPLHCLTANLTTYGFLSM